MSDLKVAGFASSALIEQVAQGLEKFTDAEKKDQMKKTNGIFELEITNADKQTTTWTIDLKKEGTVYKGKAKPKADVTIIMSDDTFTQLAAGKLNGQKAFMSGKLKTKGNMMLATKLDAVLKAGKAKL